MSMIVCPNKECGKKIHAFTVTCPYCGIATKGQPPASAPITHKLSWMTLAIGYVGAVVVPFIGFIVGIYVLIRKNKGHGLAMLLLSMLFFLVWMGITMA